MLTALNPGDVAEPELDPRWEWHRAQAFGMPDRYVRGRCNHLETEPVTSVTGEEVARLCRTCDTQLPASREMP